MIRNSIAMYSVMRDHRKSNSELKPLIQSRLRELLVSAYENVPYYQNIMHTRDYNPRYDYTGPDDLSNFPILSKDVIKHHGYRDFLSDKYEFSNLHMDKSSGTTGKPFTVWREPTTRSLQIACWLRVFFLNGYKLTDKVISFTAPARLNEGNSYLQKIGFLRRLPIDSMTSAKRIIEVITNYRPDILYGNRFTFEILMREMLKKSIRFNSIKLILMGGEIINQRIRDACIECFGIPLTEFYGLVETGILGYETPKRNGLHLNEDQVYYEFLDTNGNRLKENEIGNLVVTRFSDRAMPFIRYNVGDRVSYEYIKSGDAESGRVIKSILGRDNEIITLPDGRLIPFTFFERAIAKDYNKLDQFRIIQETHDFFRILIVGEKRYCEDAKSTIKEELDKMLHPLSSCVVESVSEIPIDESGKSRAIIPYQE